MVSCHVDLPAWQAEGFPDYRVVVAEDTGAAGAGVPPGVFFSRGDQRSMISPSRMIFSGERVPVRFPSTSTAGASASPFGFRPDKIQEDGEIPGHGISSVQPEMQIGDNDDTLSGRLVLTGRSLFSRWHAGPPAGIVGRRPGPVDRNSPGAQSICPVPGGHPRSFPGRDRSFVFVYFLHVLFLMSGDRDDRSRQPRDGESGMKGNYHGALYNFYYSLFCYLVEGWILLLTLVGQGTTHHPHPNSFYRRYVSYTFYGCTQKVKNRISDPGSFCDSR